MSEQTEDVQAPKVDQNALKSAQVTVFVFLLIGFLLDNPWFVAVIAVSQFFGATRLRWAPLRLVYRFLYRPIGIVKPNLQPDHHAPHQFASFVGALFNTAAVLFLLAESSVAGWVLVWIVILLANLNLWLNFCVGCWMYFALGRLGIPGFRSKNAG